MEKLQIIVGKFMFVGVILCLILVSIGGISYLVVHGNQPVNWQAFANQSYHSVTLTSIWQDINSFSPQGIIQLGLFVLLAIQILRVALTVWLFVKSREKILSALSLFILLMLLYFAIWRF